MPGPDFTSDFEPGVFRSAFVALPADGPAIRISSTVMPAFGIDLCRLQLEPLLDYRAEPLGSFFDPGRRGRIFVMSKERDTLSVQPAERGGWSYAGPSLGERLGRIERVRLIRERVTAKLGGKAVGWTADRGFVIDVHGSEPCLLLAAAESAEQALFLPVPRLYRALLAGASGVPGATARDLLGYGEWQEDFELALETVGIAAA